jgi:hypothetical protein
MRTFEAVIAKAVVACTCYNKRKLQKKVEEVLLDVVVCVNQGDIAWLLTLHKPCDLDAIFTATLSRSCHQSQADRCTPDLSVSTHRQGHLHLHKQ